jgi:hypothetical protein
MRLHGQKQAGTDRIPIQQYCAGSTDTMLTANMRAGEAQVLTQKIGQELAR